ncbi:class I SAM-dependent DNA methyltransferase [Sphingopyxis terrae]|uniref:class I SAM-dependent DNA methyltransferase n=1 Tax=Sphingopyxis terrae TaxID=33052 RepID=UPI003F7F7879
MNAVEIEEAVSDLVLQPFDAAEFPFQFITAFGAKKATVDRLRKGDTNQSDVGGVLQRNNIHIGIAPAGEVGDTLAQLRASPKTASVKAKFILATDGEWVEAEEVGGGDPIACAYADLPRYFAMFLPLAGISTVKEIKNNPIDVKATGRLNKLYVELLKDNPDWATEERRHELNQFMARLIFCFFAEDTGIFREHQFTETITQMSHAGHGSGEEQWGNTHEVLTELFRAMDTPVTHEGNLDPRYRQAANIRPYADVFPYVNGGLFTGAVDAPRFSRTARAYLLRAGELDWKEINPDIFGSMIQAVAEDDERGELGMHYTSVPNILKVLNPLFLDDLRQQLDAAGDSKQRLRNLRKRLGNIRVFDPACGSGNFLVIAYKEMRAIEAQVVQRLGGEANLKLAERRSVIPLSNFYGIEIKGFAAEIARLALLIAEFQADCLYLNQQEARAMVLPLHKTGQITVGNALREDWLRVCPPVRIRPAAEEEIVEPTGRLPLEENVAGVSSPAETYVCGNPPYVWSNDQTPEQKADLLALQQPHGWNSRILDYVSGWLIKYAGYTKSVASTAAFVTTNSITQGSQVDPLWSMIFAEGVEISFAHSPFKWANLASANAGVTCVIIGLTLASPGVRYLYDGEARRETRNISPYLLPMDNVWIAKLNDPINGLQPMLKGNQPTCGGALILSAAEHSELLEQDGRAVAFIRRLYGADEIAGGAVRYCLWIDDNEVKSAEAIVSLSERLQQVRTSRAKSSKVATQAFADRPHRFTEIRRSEGRFIAVPCVSSEEREYITPVLLDENSIITNRCFGIYNPPIFYLAILSSKLHQLWVETSSGKLETRLNYSNTLSWNTFPVHRLTDQDKVDLTRTAENILLAREAHFPATIADLYDPAAMPDDLRRAHEENDELLERIYIGRRFRNDTERLEKLFDLYTKMTLSGQKINNPRNKAASQ